MCLELMVLTANIVLAGILTTNLNTAALTRSRRFEIDIKICRCGRKIIQSELGWLSAPIMVEISLQERGWLNASIGLGCNLLY